MQTLARVSTVLVLFTGSASALAQAEPRWISLAAEPAGLRVQLANHACDGDECVAGISPAGGAEAQTWALVAPFVWAPAMNGTLTAHGVTADIDLTLGDLIDLLPDVQGGGQGHVEVGRGQVGLIFDGTFLDIQETGTEPLGGRLTTDVDLTVLELLGMYRVAGLDPGRPVTGPTLDLLAGARYYDIENELILRPIVGPTLSTVHSHDWVDLVVGARAGVPLNQTLNGFVRGDIGGFGIGSSSDLAWNLLAGVEWFSSSCPGTSLMLGYRLFDIDKSRGAGVQAFRVDVLMHGPLVALGFRF